MRPTVEELIATHDTLHKLYLDLEDLHVPYDHEVPKAIDLTGAFIKSALEKEGIRV
jgi:hypothetical protein